MKQLNDQQLFVLRKAIQDSSIAWEIESAQGIDTLPKETIKIIDRQRKTLDEIDKNFFVYFTRSQS